MKPVHTQRTILIQHKRRSKCRLTQETFDHVTLYACVALPINPTSQPLRPPSDPAGHRGNIPDTALFHNSHHVWFFQSPGAHCTDRGESHQGEEISSFVIATRLYCVQVGIENLTNDSGGSVQQHLHHGVKLIKRAGCLFCLGVRLTCHVTELPFGVCMHWVRWMKLSAHLGGCVQISHGRVTSTEIQYLPGKHLLIPPFPFIIHLDSACYGVFFFWFSIFFI